jgi:hypothetical protein
MALITVDSSQAFASGCDIWVTPMANNSAHSGRIDWYINGQMTKALSHVPVAMEPALNNIIRENDLKLPPSPLQPDSEILIATQNHLPTRWIVMVDYSKSTTKWVKSLTESALGLKVKSIRLFSGPDFDFPHFEKSWNQSGGTFDLQIVRS